MAWLRILTIEDMQRLFPGDQHDHVRSAVADLRRWGCLTEHKRSQRDGDVTRALPSRWRITVSGYRLVRPSAPLPAWIEKRARTATSEHDALTCAYTAQVIGLFRPRLGTVHVKFEPPYQPQADPLRLDILLIMMLTETDDPTATPRWITDPRSPHGKQLIIGLENDRATMQVSRLEAKISTRQFISPATAGWWQQTFGGVPSHVLWVVPDLQRLRELSAITRVQPVLLTTAADLTVNVGMMCSRGQIGDKQPLSTLLTTPPNPVHEGHDLAANLAAFMRSHQPATHSDTDKARPLPTSPPVPRAIEPPRSNESLSAPSAAPSVLHPQVARRRMVVGLMLALAVLLAAAATLRAQGQPIGTMQIVESPPTTTPTCGSATVVPREGLNVRKAPRQSGEKTLVLPRGTVVTLACEQQQAAESLVWQPIIIDGQQYYVAAHHLH